MTDNQWRDHPALAQRVLREGLAALKHTAGVVKEQIGDLSVLSEEESRDLASFRSWIEAYGAVKTHKRPLCLGVFGPPGSGKSFAVSQVLGTTGHSLRVINLSQLEGPGELSSALAEVARWALGKLPVVFFDEFDSALDGTPLGWLQWVLAPMQDGVVLYHGHAIEMKRAVFVFAGGTADTFEQFPGAHAGSFRRAKGPDFISRLRGHLNVRGVNEWPYRRVRRATVFRLAIERVAPGLLDASGKIPDDRMPKEFVDQILSVGRFVHGARSVEALVEMSTSPNSKSFTKKELPPREVLETHVDPGPLGGLAIALSAGGRRRDEETGDYDQALEDCWTAVATRLMELGAGLVYGGDLRSKGFTKRLLKAESRLPMPIDREDSGIEAFAPPARVTCYPSNPKAVSSGRIGVRTPPGLTGDEYDELSLPRGTDLSSFDRSAGPVSDWKTSADWCKRLGRALELFRLRAEIARLTDACLVFGGRESRFSGRFPGIAEEVMLGLAAGSAIYICGGFGGAAAAVGKVLGLGPAWLDVPDCLRAEEPGNETLKSAVHAWGERFQMTHQDDLPLDYAGLVAFLRKHALGGPRWPENGLTVSENRALFGSQDPVEITRLVVKGIRLRFADNR